MSTTAQIKPSIQYEQAEFIEDFNSLEDWMLQYECLLELTADMPPLQKEEKCEANRISSCQANLWLVLEFEDGSIRVRADSESLIVKGIAAVIVALFDNRTPEEICDAQISFLEDTPIKSQISTDRFNGMVGIIKKIKDFAKKTQQRP